MKYTQMIVLALSLGLGISACEAPQNEQESGHHDAAENHEHGNMSEPSENHHHGSLTPTFSAYFALKEALVESDQVAAQTAASNLVEATEAVDGASGEAIRTNAAQLAQSSDLEEQRMHFKTLSDAVYAHAKVGGTGESTLYYQFCPMALDNTGAYWLSTEMEIRNPYFGDKMLKCGTVKETLNQ